MVSSNSGQCRNESLHLWLVENCLLALLASIGERSIHHCSLLKEPLATLGGNLRYHGNLVEKHCQTDAIVTSPVTQATMFMCDVIGRCQLLRVQLSGLPMMCQLTSPPPPLLNGEIIPLGYVTIYTKYLKRILSLNPSTFFLTPAYHGLSSPRIRYSPTQPI